MDGQEYSINSKTARNLVENAGLNLEELRTIIRDYQTPKPDSAPKVRYVRLNMVIVGLLVLVLLVQIGSILLR